MSIWQCLSLMRPDVVLLYLTVNPQFDAQNETHLRLIFTDWFQQLKRDGAAGNPVAQADEAWSFTTLMGYAEYKGCNIPVPVIPIPPSTSPNPTRAVGGHQPVGRNQWEQLVSFIKENPLPVAMIVGIGVLVFYRPGTVTFGGR